MLPLLKKARYLIPFIKPITLGLIDPKDELTKDLLGAGLDIFGAEAKGKIKDLLTKEPDAATGLLDEHLVRHTGAVLGQLVRRYAKDEALAGQRKDLYELANNIPDAWGEFLKSDDGLMNDLRGDELNERLAVALAPGEAEPALNPQDFVEFFRWVATQKDLLGPLKPGLTPPLAEWITEHLDQALLTELCRVTPEGAAAFKDTLLRFHTDLKSQVAKVLEEQKRQGADAERRHNELMREVRTPNQEARLSAYKRSLLAAFRPYQELAIDNFAAAEQSSPDIWDIFVHPACATEHLLPEDMDAAQREVPPRLPAQDLLPLLAREDHRRTVLLADPGMGKSTLVQSLVAHLASGRPLSGASALGGLLPVPLILRDLVPLLPQEKVATWSWGDLLTAFLEHYQRDEAAPALCEAFRDHLPEFRHHLHNSPAVFFLIDGLDEIGDLAKRRQIVRCIQDAFRDAHEEARWLITSRVIGYDEAAVDKVSASFDPHRESQSLVLTVTDKEIAHARRQRERFLNQWKCFEVERRHPDRERRSFYTDYSIEESFGIQVFDGFPTTVNIAQRLHLAPFDDGRQDQFTQRWFQRLHSTDHSRELMREVRGHHHDGVRIISRVPNLLCLMNILKRSGKPLPDGRAALYDEIVKAYLGGIDAAYRLRPIHGNSCPFDPAQRRFLLCLLGAHMQQVRLAKDDDEADGNLLISRPEIAGVLVPVIEEMLRDGRVVNEHSAEELLEELLHHIASRSGLLIPRSTDAEGQTLFGFTHLSFLEFFAAEWLGQEFDRQRNRIVRRSEAAGEGQELSEVELDREFPPQGPVQHRRGDFEHLPALSAWHEPLIFLVEGRKADTATLLRWLFPALHSDKPYVVSEKDKHPQALLPFDAVSLAVKLTHDSEVALSSDTRRRWWQRLWGAYLKWPFSHKWNIPTLLLERVEFRAEVFQALVVEQPKHPSRPLELFFCKELTSADLQHLNGLNTLRKLSIWDCDGLRDTDALVGLPQLEELSLLYCSRLQGPRSFQGLAGLKNLRKLHLNGCGGFGDTSVLAGLQHLENFDLHNCDDFKGSRLLRGLEGLKSLRTLNFLGCTGLSEEDLWDVRGFVRAECEIYGPDGERVEF